MAGIDKQILSILTPWNKYKKHRVEEFIKNELGKVIRSLTLSQGIENVKLTPDENGNISMTIKTVEVDASLDVKSTNAVQNAVVASKLKSLEDSTPASIDAELSEDGSYSTLTIYNTNGTPICSCQVIGGGNTNGESSASKIYLKAVVDNAQVKESGSARLTYTYDHLNTSGESDGIKSDITITVARGTTTTMQQTYAGVGAGQYEIDLSPYLLPGTVDIYIKATCIAEDGIVQTKQAYCRVDVVTLSLTSGYDISSALALGGYADGDIIEVPYTITGSGTKNISLYLDGSETPITQTVSKSGTNNGVFAISASLLAAGRHTIQMVAERDGLLSDSIYFDILKTGLNLPFIGIKIVFKDGRIYESDHLTPRLSISQYEELLMSYVAYDPTNTTATVVERQNGQPLRALVVPRTVQTYSNRFTANGEVAMQFVCGATQYDLFIDIAESHINVAEATSGQTMKLMCAGRSNKEENPAEWTSGGFSANFSGVDWQSSGWIDGMLRLRNGAKVWIDNKLFNHDAAASGMTFEIEYRVKNIIDSDATIISCIDGSKGILITASKAAMWTGSTKEVTDEDGVTITTNVGVEMEYAPDKWHKVAFVVGKRTDGRLMELYFNGERRKADIYAEADNFLQADPQGILIDSTYAEIEIKASIRTYSRALSDDELLGNHIVDREDGVEMSILAQENDVMTEDGSTIDIDKIIKRGRGVMLIVRKGGLAEVDANNDKNADFLADVYIWTPNGDEIVLINVYIRIQGTSSTKYAKKNYSLYSAKGVSPQLYINGVLQDINEFSVMEGEPSVKVFNAKCDFSDSSMTHNTGLAKLFTNVMRELGYLTPPQELNSSIRASINGWPMDVFSAETIDGERSYHGQYNFNHDKSGWAKIVGFEGVEGIDSSNVIALECLNNTQKLGLFQVDNDASAQFDSEFANALEFNYPKDTVWKGADTSKGEKNASSTQRSSILRLWKWVQSCVPSDASAADLKTFVSDKFKNEISQYFSPKQLCGFYIFGELHACIDQRVKNIIWVTWDGKIWFPIFYDGDGALGSRNDCFLAYKYTVDRDTWDAEKSKYAFEGFYSNLWNLVLANLADTLKTVATEMAEKLPADRTLEMLNIEQMSNWSTRQYNKSGELKYIKPMLEGVNVNGTLTKYPHIYALQGSRESHRIHFVKNRFALIYAKYETGALRSDNIDMYLSREATAVENTMTITAAEPYYFGYGTNNAPSIQPVSRANKGESVTLTFSGAYSMNDPIRVYGASRVKKLDMRGVANNITGDINLNKCLKLQELDISTAKTGAKGWCLVLDQCTQLRSVNVNGQRDVRTGTLSSTELNLSAQTRLENLNAGGVGVPSIVLAEGAPVETLVLPDSLTTLRLEHLPVLKQENLVIEGFDKIEVFRFAGCPGLNWNTILAACPNIKRIRIVGINMEGNGALLEQHMTTGGIDANGNAVDTCALVGTYQMTKYLDEETMAIYKAHYPELNILQPPYTKIEFDERVSDDKCITNLDNNTGYAFANNYVPSGHINAILSQRYRCLGKQEVAGVMTICKLHNDNSNYYADAANVKNASIAALDGTEGDVFIYEPHYWYKGVNDLLNGKRYAIFSSNRDMPPVPYCKVITYDEINSEGYIRLNYAIVKGASTLAASYSANTSYAVGSVVVNGWRKVRFPTTHNNNAGIASIFVDVDGNVINTIDIAPDIFNEGMYLIADVPEGAERIYFTISQVAEFDHVILSNSDKIEDLEPEWVEHDECLVGCFESTTVDNKLRSVISGSQSTGGITYTMFSYHSGERKMQQVDYEQHKDIANLFFAKYGRKNAQLQCGFGSDSYQRVVGTTAPAGMNDTVIAVLGNTSSAWYVDSVNAEGDITYVQISNISCMGYENWYGCKLEWMDKVSVPNTPTEDKYKFFIEMPDGATRKVRCSTYTDKFIVGVVGGKYLDTIPAGTATGSSTTHYTDTFAFNGSASRVVGRSYYRSSADCGVSYANANIDASNANANYGSRLAFRGKIVKAASVTAYKAIVMAL